MIFEATNNKQHCKNPVKRKEWLAWTYMALIIAMTIIVAHLFTNPAGDENEALRKNWIIAGNIFIIATGYTLTLFCGSRAYCRLLCPFMTISSLLYRFSMFKITPVNSDNCTKCGACNNACPMLIDIRDAVSKNEKIKNRQCILCERCVSACQNNVLKISHRKVSEVIKKT